MRAGVGRPDSTDPEIVSAWVLGRFSEPRDEVAALIAAAADEAERLIERLATGEQRTDAGVSRATDQLQRSRTGSPSCASSARTRATR